MVLLHIFSNSEEPGTGRQCYILTESTSEPQMLESIQGNVII